MVSQLLCFRRNSAVALTLALATAVALTTQPAAGATFKSGSCTPLDLAFVIDNTGSMGGALTNVKKGLNKIVNEANTVAAGNLRLGVVEFPEDNVIVDTPFADNNEAAAKTAINGITLGGGGSVPESSDEALDTVVRGLRASDRPAGKQTGDFQPPYRSKAEKIAVIITDATPGGFADTFDSAAKKHAKNVAIAARNRGIRISSIYVPTGGFEDPDVVKIMKQYASISHGQYRKTKSDGSGTATAIEATIASCAGKTTGKLRVIPSRRTITAHHRTCVTFTVKSGKKRIRGATVSFAHEKAKTNKRGHARICATLGRLGRRGVKATKSGFRRGRTAVFVIRAPGFTG
jgi:von Willebrand factor type A domain-containing protein